MSTPAWLALAATLSGLLALLVDGRRGVAVAAAALGAGGGGIASLAGGVPALLVVAGPCVGLAAMLAAGAGGAGGRPALLGPLVVSPPAAMFAPRAVRVAGGVGALLVARWLAVHIDAGLVASPVPVFSCAVLWQIGLLRAALAHTPREVGLGVLAAAVATAAFLLLRGGPGVLAVAGLGVALPALLLSATALPRRSPR